MGKEFEIQFEGKHLKSIRCLYSFQKSKELHSVSAQLKKHKIDIEKIVQIFQGYFIFGNF